MKNKLCGAFLLAVAVLHCVLGDYELEVWLHEYNNPTSRCGGCGSDMVNGTELMRCCDHNGIVDVCEDGNRCDNYFVHCFREIGSDGPCISNEFNSSIFFNTNSVQFSSDESSINVPMTGAWEGIQFHTAVMDDDDGNLQFIDNFTIDLNTNFLIPGTGFTARTVYNGTFDLGYWELSFQVSCAENFFGSDCATECIPPNNRMTCDEDGTIVCLPGFTGANCTTNIDDCSNNDACGSNGQCVDGINTFTCQCSPGFTGANCDNQFPPEVDSLGNTNAIVWGAVGAVIGAITLVLISILVLVIVTKTKKSQLKKSGTTIDDSLTDNPTYGTSWNSLKPQVHGGSVATATTSTAAPKDTSVDDPERVFDNPIYGAPRFDTGGTVDSVYAKLGPA